MLRLRSVYTPPIPVHLRSPLVIVSVGQEYEDPTKRLVMSYDKRLVRLEKPTDSSSAHAPGAASRMPSLLWLLPVGVAAVLVYMLVR